MNKDVKSAGRVLDILEYFGGAVGPKHLKDVVQVLGFPKSSTLMLLRTLEARGYLERGEDDRYRLHPAFRGSADGWVGGAILTLVRAADSVMRALIDELQETTVLAVMTPEFDIRVVSTLISPLVIRYDISDTPILPAYCSAMGQAILAFSPPEDVERYIENCPFTPLTENTITDPEAFRARLEEIRTRGWSLHVEERIPGASGAAVPIFNPRGEVVAALNIATVTARFLTKRDLIVTRLREGADVIMRRLNGNDGKPITAPAALRADFQTTRESGA
jgi:DNA-binding IclR family transcriptional regulator